MWLGIVLRFSVPFISIGLGLDHVDSVLLSAIGEYWKYVNKIIKRSLYLQWLDEIFYQLNVLCWCYCFDLYSTGSVLYIIPSVMIKCWDIFFYTDRFSIQYSKLIFHTGWSLPSPLNRKIFSYSLSLLFLLCREKNATLTHVIVWRFITELRCHKRPENPTFTDLLLANHSCRFRNTFWNRHRA